MSTFSTLNNELIVHYLKNQLSEEETRTLIGWIEEDPENKEFLFTLKEAYTANQWEEISSKADTENEWNKLQSITRKSVGKKIISKTVCLKWACAAAALFAIFTLGRNSDEIFGSTEESFFFIETKAGEQTSVQLADGSTIRLNSMTKLSYPAQFNKKNRTVFLDGEAVFDVAHSSNNAFVVNVGDYAVKVLGTNFNVSAYSKDSIFTTTLEKGKVEISGIIKEKPYITALTPGDKFVYQRSSGTYFVEKADMECTLGWSKGKLIFKNAPLNEILTQLERKFGYSFQMADDSLKKLTYTATIEKETLPVILDNISIVTPVVNYEINDDKQTVYLKRRAQIIKK